MTKLCKCGCGQKVIKKRRLYIDGHMKPWNKDKTNIYSEETLNKIKKSRDKYKGENHPMYGRHHSEESKNKISNANKGENHPMYGKHRSEETKNKISKSQKGLQAGENHPNYGKHHSEETKLKIGDGNRGKFVSEETRNKMSVSRKYFKHTEEIKKQISDSLKGKNNHFYGKKHTDETKNKMSENHYDCSGKNSSNWQGGISFEPYCPKFNEKKKEEIRKQYNRKCFNCSKDEKENGKKLSVHHTDYDKNQGCNGKTFELIPLCHSCHMKTNFNREYWRQLFINKLQVLNNV